MIYVLIPAHNEAATVGVLLWKVRQLFTSFNREYQLIVVNDASTDATDEILAPYTRALPLTLLTHRQRQGYARSLEALLREAVRRSDRPRRDLAVTLQADFSESPDDVLDLIKKLEGGADVVVADRRNRTGATRSESFARRALAAMTRKRLGVAGASDMVGTMRGYRLATIQRLITETGDRPFLGQQGWAADLELLARVAPYARTIESVTVAGERSSAARPSRLRPIVEAWRAWRASASITRMPDALPPADDAADTPRRERPAEHAAHRHHGEQRRQGRPHDESRERRQRGPRRHNEPRHNEPRHHHHERPAAKTPKGEATPSPAAAPAVESAANATPAADDGQRRRRRRRGRRGRGRGPQPGGQTQQLPPPPPPSPPSAA